VDFLNQVQLISAKPVVYLVNLPEKMYIKRKSKWLPKVWGLLVFTALSVEMNTQFPICHRVSLLTEINII